MLLGSPGQWLLLSKATALDENVVLWTGSRVSPRRPTGFAWQLGTDSPWAVSSLMKSALPSLYHCFLLHNVEQQANSNKRLHISYVWQPREHDKEFNFFYPRGDREPLNDMSQLCESLSVSALPSFLRMEKIAVGRRQEPSFVSENSLCL